MRSRVITGGNAATAARLTWAGVNGAPAAGPEGRTAGTAGKPDAQQVGAFTEQQARIQELERELQERPRQAYQQGHQEGLAAGVQQANAKLEPVMAKLAQSLLDLAGVRKRHLLEAEEDAVRLAIAVARRVIRRELSVDPESLLGVVKAAFERVEARDVHRIRAHPEDVELLKRHLSQAGLPVRLEVLADPALERGGILFETARGSLDASVSSQLKEIESGLVDLVRQRT